MNAQVIALVNQKGGVGKSASCVNLGVRLAQADGEAGLGVYVNQQNLLPGLGQSYAEIDTTCRFSHTALLIDKGDDLGVHGSLPPNIGFPHRELGMKKENTA